MQNRVGLKGWLHQYLMRLYLLALGSTATAGWPGVTAALLALELQLQRRSGKSGLKVVYLSKTGLNEDVAAAFQAQGEFVARSLRRSSVKAIAHAFIPPGTHDNNYKEQKSAHPEEFARYESYARSVWRKPFLRRAIDILITGNFGYYAEQELAAALEKVGVRVVVLHKENVKPDGRLNADYKLYAKCRSRFNGSEVFVYNEAERDIQIRAGIVSAEKVRVTGMPRLDRIHEWRRVNIGLPNRFAPEVLYLFFSPEKALPLGWDEDTGEYIALGGDTLEGAVLKPFQELAHNTFNAIVELAESRPEARVTIKTKRDRVSLQGFDLLVQKCRSLPANISVVQSGDPFELITRSCVVCGFNTTALLESIAAGKPVVVPWYGEVESPEARKYVMDLGEVVEYAYSPDQLKCELQSQLDFNSEAARPLDDVGRVLIERMTGNPDGMSSQRVRKELSRVVNETRENWQDARDLLH